MFQLTLWILPSLAACLISLFTFQQWFKYQHVPGIKAALWVIVFQFTWAFFHTMEVILIEREHKLIAAGLMYIGIASISVAWFAFAVEYVRRWQPLSTQTIILLSIFPAITLLGVWTNEWHYLFWQEYEVIDRNGFQDDEVIHGPWFYVFIIYVYALLFIGITVLFFAFSQFRRHWRPLISVILMPVILLSVNMPNILPLGLKPEVDLSPLALAIAIFIMYNSIYRYGVLDYPPILRHLVVEMLNDAVVIINRHGIIIDMNPMASKLLELPYDKSPVQPAADLLPMEKLKLGEDIEYRIGERIFDVKVSLIDKSAPASSEQVLVFRDITERHDMANELERLASIDPLTNIYNRRYFMKRCEEEIGRMQRYHRPVSLLMIDLDNFKHINDAHGHDVGDTVLVHTAKIVAAVIRESDLVARFGGEEFIVLLPEAHRKDAFELASRIRQAISDTPTTGNEQEINVTASLGLTTFDTQNQVKNIDTLIKQADEALYAAKRAGRNQVCAYTPQPSSSGTH
ncbi:MAG: diguanylate cyclase [Pseudomonadota bacterium]